MRGIKLYIFIYITISILLILLGNYLTELNNNAVSPKYLDLNDAIFIFKYNFILVFLWCLLSFFGLSVVSIFSFLFNMGQGPGLAGIDPTIYYISSFTHGFGEILVGCIVFCFTIKQMKLFYECIVYEKQYEVIKFHIKNLFNCIIPTIAFILLISAFLEVFISNRLLILLLN